MCPTKIYSVYIVQVQKISIPPMEGFLFCISPLPLGISYDLPWGGMDFFLELHIKF